MRIGTLILVLSWLFLSSDLALQADAMSELKGLEKGEAPNEHIQGGGMPHIGSMRIEDPDGTLRPLPQSTKPESRIRSEDLKEVPDAEGGTMVNVEGRFQSILQVPEGSDKAIHSHDSEDLRQKKP
jgi:hypothetical protein